MTILTTQNIPAIDGVTSSRMAKVNDVWMEGVASPSLQIHQLIASRWLEVDDDGNREIWLDALAMTLSCLRWQGDVARLSDALPRHRLLEGVDEVLNALTALGYVAQPTSLAKLRQEDAVAPVPLLLILKAQDGGVEMPQVVLAWGDRPDSWYVGSVNVEHAVARNYQAIQPDSIKRMYRFDRVDQLHDTSEEFARQQTGTSWMRTTMGRFGGMFAQIIGMSLVVGLLTTSVPLFVMGVYDVVIDAHALSSLTDATHLLLFLLLGVGIAMATEAALRLAMIRCLSWFGVRMQVLVGSALLGQFLALPLSTTERASPADQLSRIRAFDAMRDFLTGSQMLAMLELPWCLVLLVVIGLIGGPLMLVPMLGIFSFGVLAYAVRRPMEHEMYSSARSSSERQEAAMDMLTRLAALKYTGVREALAKRYSHAVRKSMRTTFRTTMMMAILEHSAHALTAIAGLTTLVVGVMFIWEGKLSVGGLVAVMILTWRLLGIVQANCVLQPRLHYLRNSAGQINRLMAMGSEDAEYQHEIPKNGLRGDIECNGVVLRYTRSAEYVLRGLSIGIEPGQVVAVMGQSGAGKSSVLKLLCGLYLPQAGSIRFDGVNMRQYVPHSLRQHMTYMPQKPDFFTGTIADNLRIVSPDCDDRAIRAAIEKAGASEELAEMPEGLATEIGIGKNHLPPSLAYRLSLARVYLQQKPIMLLDELPYDVLNSQTGERLRDALQAMRGTRTIVFVTHRTDFAALADQVIWLRQDSPPLVGKPEKILSSMQKELQP